MRCCGVSSNANFAHPSIVTNFSIVFFRDITKLLPSMVWLKNTWHSSISWWPLETGYFALSFIILFPVSFMTWVWNLCFVDLSCCFNCFFSYWPTASYEKRGSLTSSISSSISLSGQLTVVISSGPCWSFLHLSSILQVPWDFCQDHANDTWCVRWILITILQTLILY